VCYIYTYIYIMYYCYPTSSPLRDSLTVCSTLNPPCIHTTMHIHSPTHSITHSLTHTHTDPHPHPFKNRAPSGGCSWRKGHGYVTVHVTVYIQSFLMQITTQSLTFGNRAPSGGWSWGKGHGHVTVPVLSVQSE